MPNDLLSAFTASQSAEGGGGQTSGLPIKALFLIEDMTADLDASKTRARHAVRTVSEERNDNPALIEWTQGDALVPGRLHINSPAFVELVYGVSVEVNAALGSLDLTSEAYINHIVDGSFSRVAHEGSDSGLARLGETPDMGYNMTADELVGPGSEADYFEFFYQADANAGTNAVLSGRPFIGVKVWP